MTKDIPATSIQSTVTRENPISAAVAHAVSATIAAAPPLSAEVREHIASMLTTGGAA